MIVYMMKDKKLSEKITLITKPRLKYIKTWVKPTKLGEKTLKQIKPNSNSILYRNYTHMILIFNLQTLQRNNQGRW